MIDKKFDAKGIQNNGIWNHTANRYLENKPLTCPILHFNFHLQNGNIFAKLFALLGNTLKFPHSFFKSSSHI